MFPDTSRLAMATEGRGRGQGKVILLGEHAVVYGVPALAAALGTGATAVARAGERDRLRISPWGVDVGTSDDLPLARALAAMLEARGPRRGPADVDAEITLPGGAGLGSSAALGVAVLRAIDALEGVTRDDDDAQRLALAWERVFHGNPSGVDTAMAISGGLAIYRRTPAEGQKSLERVVARDPLVLVVGHSGDGASTRTMVEEVARQRARDPARFEKTLAGIEALVNNGRLAAESGDVRALGQLFDMNQLLLASWMVSTPALEDMCSAARAAGALGAKLTGGGGGGCMLALAKNDAAAAGIAEALTALGKETRIVHAGSQS
jgi:mevalonate kinase